MHSTYTLHVHITRILHALGSISLTLGSHFSGFLGSIDGKEHLHARGQGVLGAQREHLAGCLGSAKYFVVVIVVVVVVVVFVWTFIYIYIYIYTCLV